MVARSDITVLLLGETGVGKGVVAEEIHAKSARASGPFLPVHCGAIAESLLEGELFGYERGAFTGANVARAGLLEAAQGGTLFLDEIGEVSPAVQVKLLRVLENREVMRLGGRRPIKVNVRFIAATNRDLESLAAAGKFREDLYFRLNGITIEIPPLRARKDEIGSLARRFAAEAGANVRFSADALRALEEHSWPGNVRELRHLVERGALLSGGGEIRPEHLALKTRARADLDDAERDRIERTLEQVGGNQSRAAELLGISRRTLLRRLDAYRLPRPRK
jgi:DNA-binding NtrC family response regulator